MAVYIVGYAVHDSATPFDPATVTAVNAANIATAAYAVTEIRRVDFADAQKPYPVE